MDSEITEKLHFSEVQVYGDVLLPSCVISIDPVYNVHGGYINQSVVRQYYLKYPMILLAERDP